MSNCGGSAARSSTESAEDHQSEANVGPSKLSPRCPPDGASFGEDGPTRSSLIILESKHQSTANTNPMTASLHEFPVEAESLAGTNSRTSVTTLCETDDAVATSVQTQTEPDLQGCSSPAGEIEPSTPTLDEPPAIPPRRAHARTTASRLDQVEIERQLPSPNMSSSSSAVSFKSTDSLRPQWVPPPTPETRQIRRLCSEPTDYGCLRADSLKRSRRYTATAPGDTGHFPSTEPELANSHWDRALHRAWMHPRPSGHRRERGREAATIDLTDSVMTRSMVTECTQMKRRHWNDQPGTEAQVRRLVSDMSSTETDSEDIITVPIRRSATRLAWRTIEPGELQVLSSTSSLQRSLSTVSGSIGGVGKFHTSRRCPTDDAYPTTSRAPVSVGGLARSQAPLVISLQHGGASQTSPNHTLSLELQPWYHAEMSRAESETVLGPSPPGSYLVRRSESKRSTYSLSIRRDCDFLHMKITRDKSSRGYILGEFSKPYESVPAMIRHYTRNLLPVKGAKPVLLKYPCCATLVR